MGSGASVASTTTSDTPSTQPSLLRRASSAFLSLARKSTVHQSDLPEPTVNWVLLGEPSSGRRTLAKHLTLLYTHQNIIDLKKANKRMGPQIQAMIIQQLQILARVAELELQYEFGDKEFGSTYDIRLDLDELQAMRTACL